MVTMVEGIFHCLGSLPSPCRQPASPSGPPRVPGVYCSPILGKAMKLFLEHQDARAVSTLSWQLVAFIAGCCWRAKVMQVLLFFLHSGFL